MSDLFSVVELSSADADKIQKHLNKIKEAQAISSDATESVNVAAVEFQKFFSEYGQPYFKSHKLKTNDTPRSEVYNENLSSLNEDINRAYIMMQSTSSTAVSAFNFATIVSDEVRNAADSAASKVLDLNILNGYTKGRVIVAGDDFSDNSKIDSGAIVGSSQAKQIVGAKSFGLSIVGSVVATNNNVKVTVTPTKPISANGTVNTGPTPYNLERFYEGKFYAFIGQQQPEGDTLNFKYFSDPSVIPATVSKSFVNGQPIGESKETSSIPSSKLANSQNKKPSTNSPAQAAPTATSDTGAVKDPIADALNTPNFFAVVPASEEAKAKARMKMFDANPDTYWQCEYVYQTEPLIDPYEKLSNDFEKVKSSGNDTDTTPVLEGTQVSIDLKSAEDIAKQYDFSGRDLEIVMEIDFGNTTPINYILINPVVPGTSSFIKVLDVATADSSNDFVTVEGFDSQSFDKTLTPEANKYLDADVQAKTLAPSAYSYAGLGVFSFPVRFASKVRIKLLSEDPVPAVYERMHVLLQEETTLTTTVKKKKKGI